MLGTIAQFVGQRTRRPRITFSVPERPVLVHIERKDLRTPFISEFHGTEVKYY